MPHLSPLNWIFLSMAFWIILMLLTSLTWWHQTPKFPNTTMSSKLLVKKWSWK